MSSTQQTMCHYFDAGVCLSCTYLSVPQVEQRARLQSRVSRALGEFVPDHMWEPMVTSAPSGFRNKAKLLVAGTCDNPSVGIVDDDYRGIDLRECALYVPGVSDLLAPLAQFISTARLIPYDIVTRQGELKALIVMAAPSGQVMVRFVLRSTNQLGRLRRFVPALLAEHREIVVASANIHPKPVALLEGDDERVLTDQASLSVEVGDAVVEVLPRSFFQTNTVVAGHLYRQAVTWLRHGPHAKTVWDLYCGVGGFAAHLAPLADHVVGVESSQQAVESARKALGGLGAEFVCADAALWAQQQDADASPNVVVVNPPRRGVGTELSSWLNESSASTVLYSSCNVTSLARDLRHLSNWQVTKARAFEMFPHTDHVETMVLLTRQDTSQK